ncbi:MAG: DUF3696 domain-containing protein [Proteobacteria bacterium]|nr:MAG: DUF3696 domain-containing protein [Pseudomonadota bacterium]
MIQNIKFRRFKAFRDAELPLKALNLLAGINGSGKSTCLHVLLLLRQSHLERTLSDKGMLLRGALLNLGKGADVYHNFSSEEVIDIEIAYDDGLSIGWSFNVDMDSDLLSIATAPTADVLEAAGKRAPFNQCVWYLGAERIAPDTSYDLLYHPAGIAGPLGQRGEFAVDFLAKHKNASIAHPSRRHPSQDERVLDLLSSTRAWLREVSPGISLDVERFSGLDRVGLTYEYIAGTQSFSHRLRPTNVGFGITYVLPIIVALLAAKAGDLLLLENPESHVHPQGQLQLGILTALAAASGLQVIVETHSDHFLNGIRVAAKRGWIKPDEATINFFERDSEDPDHATEIFSPKLDSDGKLSRWPKGFFDQWEAAMFELL